MKSKENKDMILKDFQANTFSNFKDLAKKRKNFQKTKERDLFLYFSANSFFKNNHYVNTLVNGRMMSAQK
jgi:hypothetical protein